MLIMESWSHNQAQTLLWPSKAFTLAYARIVYIIMKVINAICDFPPASIFYIKRIIFPWLNKNQNTILHIRILWHCTAS